MNTVWGVFWEDGRNMVLDKLFSTEAAAIEYKEKKYGSKSKMWYITSEVAEVEIHN